jgi:hypothetical protein
VKRLFDSSLGRLEVARDARVREPPSPLDVVRRHVARLDEDREQALGSSITASDQPASFMPRFHARISASSAFMG